MRKFWKPLTVALMLSTAASGAQAASLFGTLQGSELWATYKQRFVKQNGRVVDNANKNISHSEGQGFSMLIAVAANDPAAFAKIWQFTQDHMMVRGDNLIAWRWSPSGLRRVSDKNNASDGDLLVAWALLEAAENGFGAHYAKQARAILKDLRPLIRKDDMLGLFLRPGAFGFDGAHQQGMDIVNLSYWVFPALERISALTGDGLWRALAENGEPLIHAASANRAGLPADWTALQRTKNTVGTSHKFSTEFSYNAVRIPLYLAWSDQNRTASVALFESAWVNRAGGLQRIEVRKNKLTGRFGEVGYRAVAALVKCSTSGEKFPDKMRKTLDKHYYPASLHLLSIIATKQRYPQCW